MDHDSGLLGVQGSSRSASPAVTVGAPVESEEVEVRFGIPVDRDAVTVQLLASPSRSATPQPPAPPETMAAAPAQQPSADDAGRAAALAGAARFVFEKIAELRADLAKARLEMLKGEPTPCNSPCRLPAALKLSQCPVLDSPFK